LDLKQTGNTQRGEPTGNAKGGEQTGNTKGGEPTGNTHEGGQAIHGKEKWYQHHHHY